MSISPVNTVGFISGKKLETGRGVAVFPLGEPGVEAAASSSFTFNLFVNSTSWVGSSSTVASSLAVALSPFGLEGFLISSAGEIPNLNQ